MANEGRTGPYINIHLEVTAEGDKYVSRCVELGTASCGDTQEEALANIKDAARVQVEALAEVGELGHFLEERNIVVHHEPLRQAGKLSVQHPQPVPSLA